MAVEDSSNDVPWPSPAYAWYVASVLSLAYMVSFIDRQILTLLVAPIQADLSISDTQIGLLQGLAFALFYCVLGIPIARLADRKSRRNIILAGIVTWCLMTALCGAARGFWQLFAARVGVGVGEAALSPPAYSLLADYFPPERLARATGLYSLGVYAGGGIALLVGGAVIEAIARMPPLVAPLIGEMRPWQTVFVLVGLIGLPAALLVATIREPLRRDHGGAVATDQAPDVGRAELFAYLGANPRLLIGMTTGFSLLGIVIIGFISWVPSFLMRVHDWTAGEVGLGYGLMLLICGAAGAFGGGWIADARQSAGVSDAPLRTAFFAGLIALPFAVAGPLLPSAGLALAGIAVATLLLSAPVGLAAAALQLSVPNRLRAQVTAIYFLVVALIGTGLGPIIVALATDYLFADPRAVGRSLSLVAAALTPFGLGALFLAFAPFRRIRADQRAQPRRLSAESH